MRIRVKSISIYVNDQERALRFYQEAFGFLIIGDVPLDDGSGDRWIEIQLPEDTIGLTLLSAKAAKYFGETIGGWSNVVFSVDDMEAEVHRIQEAGGIVTREPEILEWGEWAVVADPDGNQLGLTGERERP